MIRASLVALIVFACSPAAFAEDAWTPPPPGQDAYDTMRHLYRELLRFKSDPVFLKEHWKAGTPYASFKKMVSGMDRDKTAVLAMMKDCNERDVSASFCMPSDLERLGTAYYLSGGQESEATREWRAKFDKMLGVQSLAAAKPADDDDDTVESVRARIANLEEQKSAAVKAEDRDEVRRLTKELKAEKTRLNKLSRAEASKFLHEKTAEPAEAR